MRIAMVTRAFPKDSRGGGEEYFYQIWKRALNKYDVYLISGWRNNPSLLPKGSYKIDLRIKNKFLNYYNLYKKTSYFLKKIKPDLIHTGCLEVPRIKIPTIITSYHVSHLIHNKDLITKLQKILAKKRLKKFDKIVTISKTTLNDLIKLGIPKKEIKVIYCGVDTKKFKPKKTKNKKFTIVYPSRISYEKGQHIAISALKFLPKKTLDNLQLILVGFVNNRTYLSKLTELASNLPIKIHKNPHNIVKYYQQADIIVFPTLISEGFGLVAAEALACEKPLIASNFPAIKEVIGKSGLLIKPNESKELAKAILRLYNNKKLRRKLTRNSRERIKKLFSWDRTFKEYSKIYESLVKK